MCFVIGVGQGNLCFLSMSGADMPVVLHVEAKRKHVSVPCLLKGLPCPSGFCVAALHSSLMVERHMPRGLTDV